MSMAPCSQKPVQKLGSTSRFPLLNTSTFFSLTFTSRNPALLIVGCSRNTWLDPAASVPQDRWIPSWNGRSLVSKAGRHGGHKPQAFHWVVSFRLSFAGGAKVRWLLLLRLAEFCVQRSCSSRDTTFELGKFVCGTSPNGEFVHSTLHSLKLCTTHSIL